MEHIRIDEGIKRGAKAKLTPMRRPKEGKGWTIPEDLDPDAVLREYLSSGKTSGIAKRHGVYRGALTRWLQKVRPAQWKEVQVIRALCTKEDGTEEIYDSASALQLSRARELRRAGEWDLERLSPDYAPKQEIAITIPELVLRFGQRPAALAQPNPIIDLPADAVQREGEETK